jgi:cephalosporin hydroxylase
VSRWSPRGRPPPDEATRPDDEIQPEPDEIADAFLKLYYEAGIGGGTWLRTSWMGVPVLKLPLDLWIYQEILHETRPAFVVETGTARGGSALFLAQLCSLLGSGHVVTVDLELPPDAPSHPLLRYVIGSSTDEATVQAVRDAVGRNRGMVVLDSNHTADHVRNELDAYAGLVAPGCYLVVEDTIINGHPVLEGWGAGPAEAVRDFLTTHPEFEVDRDREKLLVTFNRSGYLRRLPD